MGTQHESQQLLLIFSNLVGRRDSSATCEEFSTLTLSIPSYTPNIQAHRGLISSHPHRMGTNWSSSLRHLQQFGEASADVGIQNYKIPSRWYKCQLDLHSFSPEIPDGCWRSTYGPHMVEMSSD